MNDQFEERINRLETEIKALKQATEPRQTVASGIAAFVAIVLFSMFVLKIPLAEDTDFGLRLGLGVVIFFVGCIIMGVAIWTVEKALKVITEILAAVVVLMNCVFLTLVWSFSMHIKSFLINTEIATESNVVLLIMFFSILLLAVGNLFSCLILYPLARIAGTKIN